ncbi:hypothetical protein GALMADRAFT_144875 [Galerina marginata CBS 339.88]|uniref:Uncharacterized protein n=1 Tax=Galerina marginata (strain CBS 339.88) TaxID=685588 RepID=A0A067SJK1_GALM3|nr:hypothetical protein GALMADRAFT_144875 [Galerina marginata CBS 339.88]
MTYTTGESSERMNNEDVRRRALSVPIARKVRRSRKRCRLQVTAPTNIEGDASGNRPPPLRLTLNGGRREKKVQSAQIAVSCAEDESLKFVGEENSIHSFLWATPHGCPTAIPQRRHPDISITQEQEQEKETEEPTPDGTTDGDDDLMPSHKHKTRRWIAIIVVLLITGLVGGSFLASSRARQLAKDNITGFGYTVVPLLAQVITKLRPIGNSISNLTASSLGRLARFRQGDSQLVRWAQEDMSLMDSEDVMVNGSGAYNGYDSRDEGWDANGLDEYIPLTISPKYGKGRRVRSYGATPDVETFEERGIMTGLSKYFHK